MKISNLIPMNLQLFGGDIESPVNAEPVVNVEPQQGEQVTADNNVSGEVVDTQSGNKPVQSAEENSKFAAIRREAEAKAQADAQKIIDAEYSRLYGAEYGIHSKADYDKAVKEAEEQQRLQAEAERMSASPELLKKIEELTAFKNETLAEKQQREAEENVKAIQKEADDIISKAKEEGLDITAQQLADVVKKSGVGSLQDAYKLIKADHIDLKAVKESAIKEYIEARKAGKIPVEGSGTTPVVASETPKDFNSARKGALEMLRAAKIFNN